MFTANKQLYRVALDILQTYETQFTNFVSRIGGMHWVLTFVGCIGVLMKNNGLLYGWKVLLVEQKIYLQGKGFP